MLSQRGQQPRQPHTGSIILNIVDPIHSPSAVEHVLSMDSHLPSMEMSCSTPHGAESSLVYPELSEYK